MPGAPGSVGTVDGDGSQLGERIVDQLMKVPVAAFGDPLPEGNLEHQNARLGGDGCAEIGHSATAQRLGPGHGERGELGPLTLLQLGIRIEDLLSARGDLTASLDEVGDGTKTSSDRLEGRDGGRGPFNRLGEALLKLLGAGEEHLALIREIAEERAPGQPGALGDLGHGDVLEPTFLEQFECGLLEPAMCTWLPPRHIAILVDDSQ